MSAVLTYRFFPSYLKVIRMSASTFAGPLGKNPNLKAKLKAKIQMARGVKIDSKIDNKVEERKRRLWESRTGTYLARGHAVRTKRSKVCSCSSLWRVFVCLSIAHSKYSLFALGSFFSLMSLNFSCLALCCTRWPKSRSLRDLELQTGFVERFVQPPRVSELLWHSGGFLFLACEVPVFFTSNPLWTS